MNEQNTNNLPSDERPSESQLPSSAEQSSAKPAGRKSWLNRKIYTTRAEKQKDFFIGILIFLGLNGLMYFLSLFAAQLLYLGFLTVSPDTTYTPLVSSSILFCRCILPVLANLGLLIYFARTRAWMALGMLAAFGFSLLAGLVLTVVCFTLYEL